jgi:hypothetical protein
MSTFMGNGESNPVEEGFHACQQKRLSEADNLFRQAIRESREGERPALLAFFAVVKRGPSSSADDWWKLASAAPTWRTRISCLKLAVLTDPQHLAAWKDLIGLCQRAPTLTFKAQLQQELRYCIRPGIPSEVVGNAWRLLTEEERSRLSEQVASQVRAARGDNALMWGVPVRRFRDWVVTTGGIECAVGSYEIDWRTVWQDHWEAHLKEKRGGLGSYRDFLQALHFARSFFPSPDDFPRQEALRAKEQGKQGSPSEVIITNFLTAQSIPFVYKQQLALEDGSFCFPPFTLTWQGLPYYWEHVETLKNAHAVERCDQRLEWYREHGLLSALLISTEVGGLESEDLLKLLQERFEQNYEAMAIENDEE